MGTKQKIHDCFFQNSVLRSVYCTASYVKGAIGCFCKLVVPILRYRIAHRKPTFLVFTPEHANLGDHAIAYAEEKMFERLGICVHEVTGAKLYTLRQYRMLKVLDHATIFVNGGGNLGTLWPEIESMNRSVIGELDDSVICFFPNSIYYDNDPNGEREFQSSIMLYRQHPRLFLYAREERSFRIMRRAYQNVKLSSDMVLSLNFTSGSEKRSGCLLCMRNDAERTVTEDEFQSICAVTGQMFESVVITNTVLDHNVAVQRRETELLKKFKEFRSAELVITDRLHGMIFCAITGTKCIVFDGKSPKIRGCYEDLKELGYIRFAECAAEIAPKYEELSGYPNVYHLPEVREKHNRLEEDVMNIIMRGTW